MDHGYFSCIATGGVSSYTYSNDNGVTYQNSNVFTGLLANTYNVWVKDGNGCTVSQTITITQAGEILLTVSSDPVTCAGSTDGIVYLNSVLGGTAPFTVSLNGGTPIPFTGVFAFTGLQGGLFHFIEVVDSNGCHSASYGVEVLEPDSLELSVTTVIDVSCFGVSDGSISLSANQGTPAYTFTINNNGNLINSNSGNSAIFSNLSGGQYPTYLSDLNGCTDTLIVDVFEPNELLIDSMVILSNVSCFGADDASIIVYPSGGTPYPSQSLDYTFLWSPSGTTDHKDGPLAPGVHTVTVTDANGCSVTASESIATVAPIIATIIPDSAFITMGDTVQLGVIVQNALGNNLQYSWTPTTGLSCSDCANPVVTIYNDIDYSVVVTDSNGCTNYNYTEVFITVNSSLFFFIPNGFTPDGDGINDRFGVLGQDIKTVEMMIFNRWGEKVFEGNNQFQTWDGLFNGVVQSQGVYSYVIDVTFLNDVEVNKKGSLTLLK